MKSHTIILVLLSIVIGATTTLSTNCSTAPNNTGGNNTGGTPDTKYPKYDAWVGSANLVLYTGESKGGGIGPAITDPILPDATAIATITTFDAGQSYTYTLGSLSGTISADAEGKLIITKKLLASTTAADGTTLAINKAGGDAATAKVLAVYHPTQIFTWQDLQAMRMNLAASYTLMKDILFPTLGTEGFPATGFVPVGNDTTRFTGSLDGNGKTVRGLTIQSTANYVGLFGAIEAAAKETEVVKNLTLHNASIAGVDYVGVIAGQLHKGTISNVAITVEQTELTKKKLTGNERIGGVVGRVEPDGVIHGRNHIHVEGTGAHVGGLAGANRGKVTGYSTGNVSGTINVGGLVGLLGDQNDPGISIVIGYVTGSVSGGTHIGGLVGYSYGTLNGYATGNVSGTNNVGGLVGLSEGSGTIDYGIEYGYVRGSVTLSKSSGNTKFGAIVGSGLVNKALFRSGKSSEGLVLQSDGTVLPWGKVPGPSGREVTVDASTQQSAFNGLDFDNGIWVWVANGKWPAINIGDIGGNSIPTSQPIDP